MRGPSLLLHTHGSKLHGSITLVLINEVMVSNYVKVLVVLVEEGPNDSVGHGLCTTEKEFVLRQNNLEIYNN